MKFCNSVLRATAAGPTQNIFQAANQYIFDRENPFAFPPKDCALLHVHFLSRKFKQPCLDQTQKRCVSEIPFQKSV